MRVFLAIEFTEEIKEYLYKTQQVIVKDSASGNLTGKENFHLTLRFIGEIKDNELSKLKEAVDNIYFSQKEFKIYFNKIGQFPRGKKRIIWIGLRPNHLLDLLHSKLESELEKQGYSR